MTHTNDAVALAMRRAARRFGGNDGTFNSAGIGIELMKLAGLNGAMDGELVRVVLTGRADVRVLHGGGHYQLIEQKP